MVRQVPPPRSSEPQLRGQLATPVGGGGDGAVVEGAGSVVVASVMGAVVSGSVVTGSTVAVGVQTPQVTRQRAWTEATPQ